MEINKYTNVIPVKKCIFNKAAIVKLYLSLDNSGDNRICNSDDDEKRPFVYVNSITLDEFFKVNEDSIDVIKIDVQGCEKVIFEGMSNILTINNRLTIFIEFEPFALKKHGSSKEDYYNEIIKYNFDVFYIDEENERLKKIVRDELF